MGDKTSSLVPDEVKKDENPPADKGEKEEIKEGEEIAPVSVEPVETKKTKINIKNVIMNEQVKKIAPLVVVGILVVAAGTGTGWVLAGKPGRATGVLGNDSQTAPGAKMTETEAGIKDEKTFRDSAIGTLEAEGIEGEGTHHLVREGGESQNVYLTSTVIDLESFVGKKVEVWGETISARTAGWLMDVGKVKVK